MEIKHCFRCEKDWCYRGVGRPRRCGKCKSPYWDSIKKENSDETLNQGAEDEISKESLSVAVRLEKTSGSGTTFMAAKVPEATFKHLQNICDIPKRERAGELTPIAYKEQEGGQDAQICGRESYNEETGQTGRCGLFKGHRGKCGAWEIVG